MRCSPHDPVWSLRLQLASDIVRALGPGAQHTIGPSYGIAQPRMSELERGIVDRCSLEWLIRRIHRMGGSVDITVRLSDVKRSWHWEQFARMRARRQELSAR